MSTSYYVRRKVRRLSEIGRAKANRRWELDRKRRDNIARMTAEEYPSKIVRRIVVIDNETEVRETVIWNFESARRVRQKQREALDTPINLSPLD